MPYVARGRARAFRAAVVTVLAVAAVGAAALLAGSAGASPVPAAVRCHGAMKPSTDDKTRLAYDFTCSDKITSYTIAYPDGVDDFDVNTLVYTGKGALVEDESFGCEGDFPGIGFNCTGGDAAASGGHHTRGTFDPSVKWCTDGKVSAKSWVVVADPNGGTEGPFPLKVKARCPAVKHAKKHTKKHKHG